jgi:hypothetical protein
MLVERRLMLRRAAQVVLAGGVTAATAWAATEFASRSGATPTPHAWADPAAVRWVADQPAIVRRADWDTVAPHKGPLPAARYASGVRAAFVHHTDNGNDYGAHEVPDIIWSIFDDHTGRQGWDDIGYNFLVDRFGTVYEGRHGGIDQPVIGAHVSGFNVGTVGIAAIGTFTEGTEVPAAMLRAISGLAAWKLSLGGVDALSTTTLTCCDSLSRYRAGSRATFAAVSGHTDADCTYCPGSSLYAALPRIRQAAAAVQRATTHPVFGPQRPMLLARPDSRPCSPGGDSARPPSCG